MRTPSNPKGAGRKKVRPELFREHAGIRLPRWMLDKLAEQDRTPGVMVEEALREKFGWREPEFDDLSEQEDV